MAAHVEETTMNQNRRTFLQTSVAFLLWSTLFAPVAQAQSWPSRPVRVIIQIGRAHV